MAERNNQASKSQYRFLASVFSLLFFFCLPLTAEDAKPAKPGWFNGFLDSCNKLANSYTTLHPAFYPIAMSVMQQSAQKQAVDQVVNAFLLPLTDAQLDQVQKKKYAAFYQKLAARAGQSGESSRFIELFSIEKAAEGFQPLPDDSAEEAQMRFQDHIQDHIAERFQLVPLAADPELGPLAKELFELDNKRFAQSFAKTSFLLQMNQPVVVDEVAFVYNLTQLMQDQKNQKKVSFIKESKIISAEEKKRQLAMLNQEIKEDAIQHSLKIDWASWNTKSAFLFQMGAKELARDKQLEKLQAGIKSEHEEWCKKEELRWKPLERSDFLLTEFRKFMPSIIQNYKEQLQQLEKINYAYVTFNINGAIDPKSLKKTYRNLAQKFHPDKKSNGAEEFKKISEAHELLKEHAEAGLTINRTKCDELIDQQKNNIAALEASLLMVPTNAAQNRKFMTKQISTGSKYVNSSSIPYSDLRKISERDFLRQFSLTPVNFNSLMQKTAKRPSYFSSDGESLPKDMIASDPLCLESLEMVYERKAKENKIPQWIVDLGLANMRKNQKMKKDTLENHLPSLQIAQNPDNHLNKNEKNNQDG